ncbi:MAG: GGDEF domain-containing protein [Firmicutes bacterium]|nr:GGDEF domain-containing protein [Bacillota bacterium]
MKNKKTVIISIIVIVLLSMSGILYFVLTKEDKDTTLSIIDKRWIESNKNKVFDISIVNNIPIFNYKGNGVFFDFINEIEESTKLDFNPISYNYRVEPTSSYAFKITKELNDSDLLIYEDNYVLVGTSREKYNNLSEINNVKIGVFEDEMDLVSRYVNTSVSIQKYKSIEELLASINVEDEASNDSSKKEDSFNDLIAIPKTVYLDKIIGNDELNIVYNITDLKEYYVLSLGDDDRLNTIIKKYFNKWYSSSYNEAYKKYFNNDYYAFKKIDDTEKAKLKSKNYVYGFVNNAPYDLLNKNKLVGINSTLIKNFASLVDVELEIKEYNSSNNLLDAFNKNEIDFMFNDYNKEGYKLDVHKTVSPYDELVVVISDIKNNLTVNSINSLLDKEVVLVDNTKIEKLFSENGNKVKKVNNLNSLLHSIKNKDIIALDYGTYYYYSKNLLSNFKVDYMFELNDEYNFVMRDISDNKLFNEFFDFYLSFVNEKELENDTFVKLFSIKIAKQDNKIFMSLMSLVIILLVIIVVLKKALFKKKKRKHNINMSKSDKLKYIDVLTSLKNRNYLNDHIELWDDNEIYPQTIVVIDLNNIAYINDNYGHQEGDTVIKDAANILIKNQLEKTEIIRTNGNEFLIYMIGYEEKQVVSYLKKLNKELKELSHGFGAAYGYSMITDAIKTIDDAVNEATLDMKNNKEETNN